MMRISFLNFLHSNYHLSIHAPHAPKLLGINCQSKLAILSTLVNYSSIVDSSLDNLEYGNFHLLSVFDNFGITIMPFLLQTY